MDPTAAPIDFPLNGETFQAYPLRDIDHETMNKWVRQEYMSRVRDSISDDKELMKVALSSVAEMSWTIGDGLRVAMTVRGVRKLASLMCRGQKLPDEEVFMDSDILNSVYDIYIELHKLSEPSSNGDDKGSSPN